MNEETKPTPAPKAAVKPAAKQPELKASEVSEIPKPSFKPGDPGVTTRSGVTEVPPNLAFALGIINSAKPEWLPTLMVRLANKCLAEKVFASPGAMSEAIVGASKK